MKNNFLLILSSSLILLIMALFGVPRFTSQSQTHGDFYESLKAGDVSGEIDEGTLLGYYDGLRVEVPPYALTNDEPVVLGASTQNRWIEVDLSEQKLRAWEGDKLFLETLVSTGLPWWPTPTGEFYIWTKLRATRMTGGTGKYAYDLPNVPYTMFFENSDVPGWRGFGLHGAYWHNQFGTRRSHGCVNLPVAVAKEIYYWVSPDLPEGKSSVRASDENPGTRIVIHE